MHNDSYVDAYLRRKVEVIEPIEVREKLKRIAESMIKTYGGKRNG